MTVVKTIIIVFLSISGMIRLWELFALWYTKKTMPRLGDMAEQTIDNPPKISVIIPACNEQETLEKAMQERLLEDYPNLEFILIDDRSSDNTGQIMQRIAARDARVKTFRINQLPQGWLGKVHALHQGCKRATGKWLLFSDADVQVKKGTMIRVISYCMDKKLDHLCILPDFLPGNLIVDTAVNLFIKSLVVLGTTWRVKNPKSRTYCGGGAFNMVGASAFRQTEGFHWLKMELVDDVCLGLLMKRQNGYASDIISGHQWVGVRWYRTFQGLKSGMGRAFYAGMGNCMALPLAVMALFGLAVDLAPYAALLIAGVPEMLIAIAVILVSLSVSILAARLVGMSIYAALLLPLANILAFYLTIRACIMGSINRGIYWRGTFYSRKDLRKGRRFTW